MIVIKEGKIPDNTKRFTCGRCGCVFECEAGTRWSVSTRY